MGTNNEEPATAADPLLEAAADAADDSVEVDVEGEGEELEADDDGAPDAAPATELEAPAGDAAAPAKPSKAEQRKAEKAAKVAARAKRRADKAANLEAAAVAIAAKVEAAKVEEAAKLVAATHGGGGKIITVDPLLDAGEGHDGQQLAVTQQRKAKAVAIAAAIARLGYTKVPATSALARLAHAELVVEIERRDRNLLGWGYLSDDEMRLLIALHDHERREARSQAPIAQPVPMERPKPNRPPVIAGLPESADGRYLVLADKLVPVPGGGMAHQHKGTVLDVRDYGARALAGMVEFGLELEAAPPAVKVCNLAPENEYGLRTDGPTLAEWLAAKNPDGTPANDPNAYPPKGYAAKV